MDWLPWIAVIAASITAGGVLTAAFIAFFKDVLFSGWIERLKLKAKSESERETALVDSVVRRLQSYEAEKGKNLATKEDVEDITRKIESVRSEVAGRTGQRVKRRDLELEMIRSTEAAVFDLYRVVVDDIDAALLAALSPKPDGMPTSELLHMDRHVSRAMIESIRLAAYVEDYEDLVDATTEATVGVMNRLGDVILPLLDTLGQQASEWKAAEDPSTRKAIRKQMMKQRSEIKSAMLLDDEVAEKLAAFSEQVSLYLRQVYDRVDPSDDVG